MIIPLLYAIVSLDCSPSRNKFGMMALFDLFWLVYFWDFSVLILIGGGGFLTEATLFLGAEDVSGQIGPWPRLGPRD